MIDFTNHRGDLTRIDLFDQLFVALTYYQMRATEKFRIIVSSLLFLTLFSSLSLKSLHHSDSHEHRQVCKSKDAKHFHENHEKTCCSICDFFFSAFKESKRWAASRLSKFPRLTYHQLDNSGIVSGCSCSYSLRAPPVFC
jgi:hypothetical protein